MICVPLQIAFLDPAPSKKGGGSSTACLKPKISIFDQKKAIFGLFFMKNGKFWCIRRRLPCGEGDHLEKYTTCIHPCVHSGPHMLTDHLTTFGKSNHLSMKFWAKLCTH